MNSSLLLVKKRSRSPNFDGADEETGPRNPKITVLVNEIINDNSPTQNQSEPPENQLPVTDVFQSPAQIPRAKGDIIGYSDDDIPSTEIKYLPATVDGLLKRFNKLYKEFTQGRHEHRNELVALLDELLRQNGISREEYTRRNNVIAKSLDASADGDDADTMHADDDDDDDDDAAAAAADDDDDDHDANVDDDTAEYVIPETDEGLKKRFNQLFIEFTRTKEHKHELHVLLDEMLNRGLVIPEEYNNLNSLIPKEETDEEEEEDGMTRVIKNTVDYVIQHDTKELSDLLMELRDDVDGELLDSLIDLELLVSKFLVDEYENEQSLLPLIEERRLKLEASSASKSKLLRMDMLLDYINKNRRRIREIFHRIDDADDNEEDVWKMLVREGLISGDQFEKLSALDGTYMEKSASVLKGAKIGQGVPFPPTPLSDLRNIFGKL